MGEEEVVPGLLHNPGAGGQRPGTMGHVLKQVVHGSVQLEYGVGENYSTHGTQGHRGLAHEMAIADSQARRVTCEHSHGSYCKQSCDHA